MKILFDENTDTSLPSHFDRADHVATLGWKGLQNGALLRAVEAEGYKVFVTADKQMRFQQNITGRSFAIIVLDIHPVSVSNQIACVEDIRSLLDKLQEGTVYMVEGPHPKRDK